MVRELREKQVRVVVPPFLPLPSSSRHYADSCPSKVGGVQESTHKGPEGTYLTSTDVI